jgi:hypothetical protein
LIIHYKCYKNKPDLGDKRILLHKISRLAYKVSKAKNKLQALADKFILCQDWWMGKIVLTKHGLVGMFLLGCKKR